MKLTIIIMKGQATKTWYSMVRSFFMVITWLLKKLEKSKSLS